jgi:hypothetical protein
MIDAVLLALGLVLSTTSQLRIAGAGVGPGEICLLLFIGVRLGGITFQGGLRVTPVLFRLVLFWTLFAVAQCIGTLTGYVIGDPHDPSLFMHDAIAYVLLGACSILSVAEPGAHARLHQTAWLVALIGAATLVLQICDGFGVIHVAGVDPWYWDRLRGWSENPNQLAIFCAAHGLLSLHLLETAKGPWAKAGAATSLVLAVVAGRLSQSDTFTLVLVASFPIFIGLKLQSWFALKERRLGLRKAAALAASLGLPVLALSAVPLGYSLAVEAEGFAKEMSKEGGKAANRESELRLQLWGEAIARGLESGMLGLGPGPHLPIPEALVAARLSEDGPKNIEHPENNATYNFEAHSTLLDLFTQGGLIAVGSFLWLTISTFIATYRANLSGLCTLLMGLAIFVIFHLIIRHPLLWFAITLCLVEAARLRPGPSLRQRSV